MNDAREIKTYIIVFWAEGVNLAALQRYLFDSADIVAYWNYIPLVYCVKSTLSATELSAKISVFMTWGFAVAEINPQNINGTLPPAAWEWFYLPHHTKANPPLPTSDLGGIAALISQQKK